MTTIATICGSLRRESVNRRLLAALPGLAPERFTFSEISLRDVPLYDQDLDTDDPPAGVVELRERLQSCDGLVIATPEYNHSMPGVLKNAIDWASRPMANPALRGRCIVVMCATISGRSGYRGLAATAALLAHLGNHVVHMPEVVVPSAHHGLVVGEDGTVTVSDALTAASIRVQLRALDQAIEQGLGRLEASWFHELGTELGRG